MKWLFLEPLDVLLFRKSQPFAAGDGARAASTFPPTVVPFQGAIRTLLLEGMGVSFDDYTRAGPPADKRVEQARALLGNPDSTHHLGHLRIRGPYLARESGTGAIQTLFPVPRNALWEEGARSLRMLVPLGAGARTQDGCRLTAGGGGQSAPGRQALLWDADAQESGASTQGLWITASGLRAVLDGRQPEADHLVRESSLYRSERRAGITRDRRSRTAMEGMLYSVDFVRLEPGVGFLVEVGLAEGAGVELGDYLSDSGFLTLGGERRATHFSVLERRPQDVEALLSPPVLEVTRFLLYLATPAVFRLESPEEPGWLPRWIDSQTLEAAQGPAAGLRVVTAALGKAFPVAGWDLASRRPKPLHWAVPGGSVYYCDVGRDPQRIVDALHAQTISDCLPEAGMGQVFVGRWPDVE